MNQYIAALELLVADNPPKSKDQVLAEVGAILSLMKLNNGSE